MLMLWLIVFVGILILWRITNNLNKKLIYHAECDDYAIKKKMLYIVIAQAFISFVILTSSFIGLVTEILKLT